MATKTRTVWYCSDCGHKQAKWSGQCSACREWNTFQEEVEAPKVAVRFHSQPQQPARAVRLKEIQPGENQRTLSGIGELDRLVGEGLVRGSLSLVAGDPGIGKSTLLLQLSEALAGQGLKILYICGEESVEQTHARAQRLQVSHDNLYFLSETVVSHIKAQVESLQPDVLIVDSIQIVYKTELTSAPGSVSQVRETAMEFMHLAKSRGLTTLLVGHVTKAGEIAGPRVLEHLVDTVLYFEGDKQQNYRMMRVIKNRFGPTDEIAVFRMQREGLTEVPNPSEIFLQERSVDAGGSVVIPTLEGSRPILVEVQALVTQTAFATPSRRCAGLDQNRLALLLAVLEKRLNYRLYGCDVFVSVVGGLKIVEPSIDLGVLLAVASSFNNFPVPYQTTVVGEVGLGGEIRSVTRIDARIREATRMGFTRCVIPKRNLEGLPEELRHQIQVTGVERVEEAIDALLTS